MYRSCFAFKKVESCGNFGGCMLFRFGSSDFVFQAKIVTTFGLEKKKKRPRLYYLQSRFARQQSFTNRYCSSIIAPIESDVTARSKI
jgi:hypothetical protein